MKNVFLKRGQLLFDSVDSCLWHCKSDLKKRQNSDILVIDSGFLTLA